MLGLVAVTGASIEFDSGPGCVSESFCDFGVRGCEMISTYDIDIACLVFLQVVQDVRADIVDCAIAREWNPRDRIIFNHIKQSGTDRVATVLKYLFREWRARLVCIDFGLRIGQLGLWLNRACRARILWRESVNSAPRVIVKLQRVTIGQSSGLCKRNST